MIEILLTGTFKSGNGLCLLAIFSPVFHSCIYLMTNIVILRRLGVTVDGADTFRISRNKQADLRLWCLLSHLSISVSLDVSFIPKRAA